VGFMKRQKIIASENLYEWRVLKVVLLVAGKDFGLVIRLRIFVERSEF
jgi:hypothetical protein